MKLAARLVGMAVLVVCAALLVAWGIGLIISDRWVWTQYLSWMPGILVVPVACVLWLVAVALGQLRRKGSRRSVSGVRAGVGVAVLLGVIYLLVFDLRAYRLPLRGRPSSAHLRVLHWNVTAIARLEQITGPLLSQQPDVAVLVNPSSHVQWSRLPAAMGSQYRPLSFGGFVILSRVPILRHGMTWLGIEPVEGRTRRDPGRAMFLELDTTVTLGRTTTLWVMDLPSEPRLSRWKMARESAAALRDWRGAVMTSGGAVPAAEGGFPAPDLVVGDFNIPRGSASFSVLLPGMSNAYNQAGAGYAATWPRYGYRTPIPLVHIDQMFVGSGWRAGRYAVVDPGFGYHMMQVGDVAARRTD